MVLNKIQRNNGSKRNFSTEPKKRGRRTQKVIEKYEKDVSEDSSGESDSPVNDSAVILGLKIDPAKLKLMKNIKHDSSLKDNTQSDSQNESPSIYDNETSTDESDDMFKNDIPDDQKCYKCKKLEQTISSLKKKLERYEREQVSKIDKVFNTKLELFDINKKKKIVIKKTNLKCWWDRHSFDNIPFFLPEFYHNGTYYVKGCFCSPNCAMAFNLFYLKDAKIYIRKTLIYKMFREMHGIKPSEKVDIREAGPWELLEDFIGKEGITIEKFRENFKCIEKEFISYVPPMKAMNSYIEERTSDKLGQTNDDDDKKYVLKRSKPLAKKRSIIASMKLKVKNNDSDEE